MSTRQKLHGKVHVWSSPQVAKYSIKITLQAIIGVEAKKHPLVCLPCHFERYLNISFSFIFGRNILDSNNGEIATVGHTNIWKICLIEESKAYQKKSPLSECDLISFFIATVHLMTTARHTSTHSLSNPEKKVK